ncbi:MAG: ABC transporter permease [Microscillaceae bacterium]|nr:ABC transporter permease [Microscillaceae bacterium]
MLKNYLKIAFRNLWNNKIYSFINLSGLALGITCCMLILLLIRHELSYDLHHPQAEQLYRVTTELGKDDEIFKSATTPPPLAWNLKKDFPEIQQVTRVLGLFGVNKSIFTYEEKRFFEEKGFYVDSTFFQIFKYEFLSGNAQTALNEPNTIVITENIAQKLFGQQSAIGKVIKINNNFGEISYKITGVLKAKQANSHIEANFLMSLNSKGGISEFAYNNQEWVGNNFLYTYLQLKPNTIAQNLEAKLPKFIDRYAGEALRKDGRKKEHFLQVVSNIHLYSDLSNEISGNSNITYVYILTAISILILLIACINFMNLSTARSGKRSKEVGLRKVLGAYKIQLIQQFMGESLLIAGLAFGLSLAFLELILPSFEQLINQNLNFSIFNNFSNLLYLLGLSLFTGFLAGIYPAFYLSAFQPIKVLKGKLGNRFSASFLRKGLVVFQFSISITLIVGTILILEQLQFLQNKDLGFKKVDKLIVPMRTPEAQAQYKTLQAEWQKISQVVALSGATSHPATSVLNDMNFYAEGKNAKDGSILKMNYTDYDFLKSVDFQLVKGRYFDKKYKSDSSKVVVNENTLQRLGIKLEEAIGKKIKAIRNSMSFEIIGVVKDFHFQSLHSPIEPYVFLLNEQGNYFPYVIINYKTAKPLQFLQNLKEVWDKYNSTVPFEYSFLENDLARQYEADQRFSWIIQTFTGIAIFIACLGLFGLASFTTEQRTKEIGIRKVLGASVNQIVILLSQNFIKLVLIAFLIASPLAYYLMSQWLQNQLVDFCPSGFGVFVNCFNNNQFSSYQSGFG